MVSAAPGADQHRGNGKDRDRSKRTRHKQAGGGRGLQTRPLARVATFANNWPNLDR
jgi:hypothetical protein